MNGGVCMNANVDSNSENVIDKSLDAVPQKTTETSITPSVATIPKAETSRTPLKVAGALTPDGRKVPLPDDPNIPRSPFEIIDPVTHEVWIQLTEPTDSSKVEEAAPAASPPKNYSPMVSSQSEAQSEFFVLKRNQLSNIQSWEVVKVIVTEKWIVMYRSKIYMLRDGIYVPFDKRYLVTKTIRLIMEMFNFEPESCSICLDILDEALYRVTEFYGQANDERYTRFRNGYFDNATGRFYINVYDYFPTMQVEADFLGFGAQLYHPLTDRFIDTIAGGDCQIAKLLWQVLGYCLSSDASAKVIIMLIGESGDNGKSTFLSFLQSFITYTGVKNLSMKNLTGSRFSYSELTDARLNISADEGAVDLNSEALGRLKSLSGHDYINADVKNRAQVRFLSTCKLLIASNHNVGFTYSTTDHAFMRRLLMIPFDVSIPKNEQDRELLAKLECEKSAVATEAMRYYLELRNSQYQFSGRDVFNKQMLFSPIDDQYNLIEQFTRDCCDFSDSEAFTATQELYTAFRNVHGNVFKDDTAFSQAFKRYNVDRVAKVRKRTSAGNCWGYRGVTLKEVS